MKTMNCDASRITAGACLLACLSICGSAQPRPAAEAAGDSADFESASVAVPAGNTCALHPDGNADPNQAITVRSDEDGVVRFLAVRPTRPDSVVRLALDCTDANGTAQTFFADLRLEDTFTPRPFNPSLTTLAFRPALARDPRSYTQQELIQAGYGLRPDPDQNPDGYQRWLAAASAPAYKLRSHRTSPAAAMPRQPTMLRTSSGGMKPEISSNVHISPSNFWTGAILQGSHSVGATAAETYSYLVNEATFNVPKVYPGAYNTGVTNMSIWNGLDNVLQAVTWLSATSTTAAFSIHHQEFEPWSAGNDNADITFTPKSGESIYVEEWYCDAKGNPSLWGGYACTYMYDYGQSIAWDCSQAGSKECPSYTLKPTDFTNGSLGFWADYIIEDDTAHAGEWPDFSPVTMTGTALVVKGTSASTGTWVTTSTDPYVSLQTDATAATPRGNGHLIITVPTGAVKWTDVVTNVYYWNGKNFNSFAPGCATSVGVGPNSRGLTNGTPWITDCAAFYGGKDFADGNHNVWQMQTDGFWVKMQNDIATQVAVSPEGHAWAINAKGEILYWDSGKFVVNGWGGCARSIGVGPNSAYQTNGTPWVIGCDGSGGNYSVYEMQTGGTSSFHLTSWVKMQANVGTQIAVSPEGIPWVINASGQILYWNGSKFVVNAAGGCAIAIGVGPNAYGLTNGTPWITGCIPATDGNFDVYQMQTAGTWVKMQNDVGTGGYPLGALGVSPDRGIAWTLSALWQPPVAQRGSQWP